MTAPEARPRRGGRTRVRRGSCAPRGGPSVDAAFVRAGSLAEARAALAERAPDVVFLDVVFDRMPEFELAGDLDALVARHGGDRARALSATSRDAPGLLHSRRAGGRAPGSPGRPRVRLHGGRGGWLRCRSVFRGSVDFPTAPRSPLRWIFFCGRMRKTKRGFAEGKSAHRTAAPHVSRRFDPHRRKSRGPAVGRPSSPSRKLFSSLF